jgi:hypothetical protein
MARNIGTERTNFSITRNTAEQTINAAFSYGILARRETSFRASKNFHCRVELIVARIGRDVGFGLQLGPAPGKRPE